MLKQLTFWYECIDIKLKETKKFAEVFEKRLLKVDFKLNFPIIPAFVRTVLWSHPEFDLYEEEYPYDTESESDEEIKTEYKNENGTFYQYWTDTIASSKKFVSSIQQI